MTRHKAGMQIYYILPCREMLVHLSTAFISGTAAIAKLFFLILFNLYEKGIIFFKFEPLINESLITLTSTGMHFSRFNQWLGGS
jgi:hypothetical protein